MFVPSSRLLATFAALVIPAAALTAWPRFSLPAYGIIGLVVALAALDASLSRNKLRSAGVTAPDLIRMWRGREAEIALTVRDATRTGRLRIGLVAPDELGLRNEEVTIDMPASGIAGIPWIAKPVQRGRYLIQRCVLETPSTLGLWAIRSSLPLATEIRVYPDLASAQRLSPSLLRRGETGSHAQRQIGRGREFEKLRDYTAGDGYDEVDWKATARRGRPITRVFQVERTQEVYVILDASRLTARPIAPGNPDSILERNITAALLLALEVEKQGDLFGLVTFSDQVHSFVRARGGKAHYGACREAIYTLQPRIVTPDFDELGSLLRLRLRRRALLVFLTELNDPVLAEAFLRNAMLLRRRHLVLAGMIQPTGSIPLFEGAPVETSDEVYQRLAGHLEWAKLRSLAKVLERQGIHFSLFQPDAVASQLAAAFVNVKRRQIL